MVTTYHVREAILNYTLLYIAPTKKVFRKKRILTYPYFTFYRLTFENA